MTRFVRDASPVPPMKVPSPLAPVMILAFAKLPSNKQRATLEPIFKFVQNAEGEDGEIERFLGFYLFHGLWHELKALVLSYQLGEMENDPDPSRLAQLRSEIFEKFCVCLDEQESLRRHMSDPDPLTEMQRAHVRSVIEREEREAANAPTSRPPPPVSGIS